jgi:hypothetical protein
VSGATDQARTPITVRLLIASDLTLSGKWAVNALPDRLGIEHFTDHGGGSISLPASLLKSIPPGSKLEWTEYAPGETEVANGVPSSIDLSTDTPSVRCRNENCTIVNVLIVPSFARKGSITRLGYAFSPVLLTPDGHRSPVSLPGDWASFYHPTPDGGYPSPLYDRSTLSRWLGLIVGLIAIAAGCLALSRQP